ncbi:MAG: hypothetical protein GX774_06585 [Armatimonadetes bacterium]|jgi:hypothetical protein|nr:hypothetical protein [Armatimonadota bacterium]
MHTYLHIEELIQEGQELQWTATAFAEDAVGAETSDLYTAWLSAAREVLVGRADPESGWQEAPSVGREMAEAIGEVLVLLQRLAGEMEAVAIR